MYLHCFFRYLVFVEGLDVLVAHHRSTAGSREALLELVDRVDQLLLGLFAELLRFLDVGQDAVLGPADVVEELGLEAMHVLGRNRVEVSAGAEEDRNDLLLNG